jgi:hypothetical protein
MNTQEINWDNPNEVKEEVKRFVSELKNDFINEQKDNPQLDEHDYVFERMDGYSLVIYTWKAKKVSLAFDLDPFGYSNLTEERFNGWEQVAFDVIYTEYFNQ